MIMFWSKYNLLSNSVYNSTLTGGFRGETELKR